MKTSKRKPLIYPIVKWLFPAAEWGRVIITFGGVTYCASDLDTPLLAHEHVHQRQQWHNPVTATLWWILYAFSARFRLSQELPAHRAEYQAICQLTANREKRAQALHTIAGRLSGPLYKNLLTHQEAMERIRG